jgi:hypothetical protein
MIPRALGENGRHKCDGGLYAPLSHITPPGTVGGPGHALRSRDSISVQGIMSNCRSLVIVYITSIITTSSSCSELSLRIIASCRFRGLRYPVAIIDDLRPQFALGLNRETPSLHNTLPCRVRLPPMPWQFPQYPATMRLLMMRTAGARQEERDAEPSGTSGRPSPAPLQPHGCGGTAVQPHQEVRGVSAPPAVRRQRTSHDTHRAANALKRGYR